MKFKEYLNEKSLGEWEFHKKWGKTNNVYTNEFKVSMTLPKFIKEITKLTEKKVGNSIEDNDIEVDLGSSSRVYLVIIKDTVFNELKKNGKLSKIEDIS